MQTFIEDVHEQPLVLEKVARFYVSPDGRELMSLAERLLGDRKRPILLTGMGSSFFAARATAIFLWSSGLSAWYVEASELLHYGLSALTQDALLIMVSQSGESAEIKELLARLPKDADTIGVTNQAASTLGRGARLVLPILAGEEGTTASKTYSASLAVLLFAAAALARKDLDTVSRRILRVAARLALLKERTPPLAYEVLADWLGQASAVALIGRGSGAATAMQGALTLKELAKIPAEAMEAAQFRHGPLEIVGPDLTALVFVGPGRTEPLLRAFALELRRMGARVAIIRDGELMEAELLQVGYRKFKNREDEHFHALTDIFPIQMTAAAVAAFLGRQDGFRWITKVTDKE